MLRKTLFSLTRSGFTIRSLSSGSGGGADGKGPKDPSVKEVLGKDLLDAVNQVADDLHASNSDAKQKTKSTLLSKLISHEKDTFTAATAAQISEMMDDKSLQGVLSYVQEDKKKKQMRHATHVLQRKERQGLVLLRKDIYYQAVQDGYSSEKARQIAEKAVEEATSRVRRQRTAEMEGVEAEQSAEKAQVAERDQKEQALFQAAYETVDNILYKEDLSRFPAAQQRAQIKPDPDIGSLLKSAERLGVFTEAQPATEEQKSNWQEWDLLAAKVTNKSRGPSNAFEEQIEWTEQGKLWPYPINNEYLLGDEEDVSFLEHIFLDRHLPSLGIPNTGPIAHFMHLVCVGLSKNPYMTAAKKMEHLRWFANYFDAEKQKLVHKLHDQEQTAAAQNA